MRQIKPVLVIALATLLLASCAARSQREVETTIPEKPQRSSDRVVTDEIPAEGTRKIPVVQQY